MTKLDEPTTLEGVGSTVGLGNNKQKTYADLWTQFKIAQQKISDLEEEIEEISEQNRKLLFLVDQQILSPNVEVTGSPALSASPRGRSDHA